MPRLKHRYEGELTAEQYGDAILSLVQSSDNTLRDESSIRGFSRRNSAVSRHDEACTAAHVLDGEAGGYDGMNPEEYGDVILSLVNDSTEHSTSFSVNKDDCGGGTSKTKKSDLLRGEKPGAVAVSVEKRLSIDPPLKKSEVAEDGTLLNLSNRSSSSQANGDDGPQSHNRARRLRSFLFRPGALAIPGPDQGGIENAERRDAARKKNLVDLLQPQLARQQQIDPFEQISESGESGTLSIVNGDRKPFPCRTRLLICAFLTVVVMLVVTGVAVLLSFRRGRQIEVNEDFPTSSPSELSMMPSIHGSTLVNFEERPCVNTQNYPDGSTQFQKLLSLIGATTVRSPQRKAQCWMIQTETPNIDSENSLYLQRYTVAVLFFALVPRNKRPFKNWMNNASECGWEGIDCNINGEIVSLRLPHADLTGVIQEEIGNLTALLAIDLANNYLSGSIPQSLWRLPLLKVVKFEANTINGTLQSLSYGTSLSRVNIERNDLSGTISSQIGNLTNLQLLGLGENKLQGQLPSELGLCSALTSLVLDYNGMESTLPTELGKLTSLEKLQLERLRARGTLPSELGYLTNLRELKLRENRLIGTIPFELGNMIKLESFILGETGVNGTMPESVCKLRQSKLLELQVRSRFFSCSCCTPWT